MTCFVWLLWNYFHVETWSLGNLAPWCLGLGHSDLVPGRSLPPFEVRAGFCVNRSIFIRIFMTLYSLLPNAPSLSLTSQCSVDYYVHPDTISWMRTAVWANEGRGSVWILHGRHWFFSKRFNHSLISRSSGSLDSSFRAQNRWAREAPCQVLL